MAGEKTYVITIVGAESSGKTSLAMLLAAYFKCPWIPEYAREYLPALDRAYNPEDLKFIAKRELERINMVASGELSMGSSESPNFFQDPSSFKSGTIAGNSELSVVSIVKSKLANSKSLAKRIVLIDGGMMTLRMWARIKFGIKIPVVENALKNDVTDLYLLCRPRKEWEHDPFREAPSIVERAWIFNLYLEELIKGNKNFEIVRSP